MLENFINTKECIIWCFVIVNRDKPHVKLVLFDSFKIKTTTATSTGKHLFKPDQWGGVVTTFGHKSANVAKYEEEANLTYLKIVAALAKPLCQGHCHKVLFSCLPLKLPFEYAASKDDKFNEVNVRYTQLSWHATLQRVCPYHHQNLIVAADKDWIIIKYCLI